MEQPNQYDKYTKGQPLKFYICDRTKCEHCQSECKFTLDSTHAKRPTEDPNDFILIGGNFYQLPTRADGFTLSRRYLKD